jgi:uncharacterized protein YndB with AHSA1/START domain
MSVFRTSRLVPAAPDAVFAAIETPTRLARWWGPNEFTNTFHTFDFRAGGSWLFTMHGPDGKAHPNEARFLEIVRNAVIKLRHVNLPHYDLTITLQRMGTGTLVSWYCVFENAAFAENARQFLETANEQNLERLAMEVGDLPTGFGHSDSRQ